MPQNYEGGGGGYSPQGPPQYSYPTENGIYHLSQWYAVIFPFALISLVTIPCQRPLQAHTATLSFVGHSWQFVSHFYWQKFSAKDCISYN